MKGRGDSDLRKTRNPTPQNRKILIRRGKMCRNKHIKIGNTIRVAEGEERSCCLGKLIVRV